MSKTIRNGGNGHHAKTPRRRNGNGKGDLKEGEKENGRDLVFDDCAPTEHHIVPRSRMHEAEYEQYIGKDNLTEVPKGRHNLFHCLLFNLTPPEIIAWLVKYLWGGQRHWIELYLSDPDYYQEKMELREKLRKNDKKNAQK
ncbi:MAG TPA: hypothetical protein PKI61_00570 [bacterium]|nr:hypothetical protein [bacterium]HPT29381.1 hypothetical protein [bacterium]